MIRYKRIGLYLQLQRTPRDGWPGEPGCDAVVPRRLRQPELRLHRPRLCPLHRHGQGRHRQEPGPRLRVEGKRENMNIYEGLIGWMHSFKIWTCTMNDGFWVIKVWHTCKSCLNFDLFEDGRWPLFLFGTGSFLLHRSPQLSCGCVGKSKVELEMLLLKNQTRTHNKHLVIRLKEKCFEQTRTSENEGQKVNRAELKVAATSPRDKVSVTPA